MDIIESLKKRKYTMDELCSGHIIIQVNSLKQYLSLLELSISPDMAEKMIFTYNKYKKETCVEFNKTSYGKVIWAYGSLATAIEDEYTIVNYDNIKIITKEL